MKVYFSALNSIPLKNRSILMSVSHCLHYCNFVVSSEISKGEFFNFVLLFQDFLAILGLLGCHMNFRISLSISAKTSTGIFIGIVLNLRINLGNSAILTILSLPTQEQQGPSIYLHLLYCLLTLRFLLDS